MKRRIKEILTRVTPEEYKSITGEAKKEKKSISQYMRDAHLSHCYGKYNYAYTCPHCDAENVREKIVCWQCGKKY